MSADTDMHPQPPVHRRLRPVIALLAIAIVAVALSACGSSSSGSGTTNSAKASTTSGANASTTNGASTTKRDGARSSRFASLRSCLQKEGVNLPSGGAGRPGGGGPPSGGAGGFKLPEGVSRSKFEEAIKKCGGGGFPGGARPGFNSAAARATLTKYADCMRGNGVDLPKPSTSGKGPVFDTKGIDTSSAAFKNAQKKCQSDLKGAFGAGGPPAGGRPPAGGGGRPPAGGYGPPPGSEPQGG